MDPTTLRVSLAKVLALAARQHGVITRAQLLELGLTSEAITHRLRRGKLHQVQRGVYAVGPMVRSAMTAQARCSGAGARGET